MATNHLLEIEALGESVWLDNISRGLIEDGDLARLVEDGDLARLVEDGVSG